MYRLASKCRLNKVVMGACAWMPIFGLAPGGVACGDWCYVLQLSFSGHVCLLDATKYNFPAASKLQLLPAVTRKRGEHARTSLLACIWAGVPSWFCRLCNIVQHTVVQYSQQLVFGKPAMNAVLLLPSCVIVTW